ncbi:Gfo/Idh/MocA family oxidoreductase [Bacillus sp. H-16]|uniref:Gfo/Idh/MocA family oxidoreductase n=1 Tax=Alteribacter salitolerans TaxID=2912333 RepID=UPI0019666E77|nr:Gfo/Idh/MocA family oxidoreductase [Alteribacter salitolerans]MBM7094954.1 Gfo/Idh/MocA family oxidoreductase [Alteribacter salitolerans]
MQTDRKKVGIIGLGHIGRRHFQSLFYLKESADIFLVDQKEEGITSAKKMMAEEFKSSTFPHSLSCGTTLDTLPHFLDIVIIASPSNVRRNIIEAFLKKRTARFMILEKVVFQRVSDFSEISQLFNEKKVTVWVNCPMRTYPFFKEIKRRFGPSPIHYTVTGSQLNLASNVIHHLDLITYLSEDNVVVVDPRLLNTPFSSKRKGFFECTGTLSAYTRNHSTLNMTSFDQGGIPPVITCQSNEWRAVIRVLENKAWLACADHKWTWEEVDYKSPLQSELTCLYLQQLFSTESCDLPGFRESWNLHIPLLQSLSHHFYCKGEAASCPIT